MARGIDHDHDYFVDGCLRCELARDVLVARLEELGARLRLEPDEERDVDDMRRNV